MRKDERSMKRALSILLALTLCLSLGLPALAADERFLDLTGESLEIAAPMSVNRLTLDEASSITAPSGEIAVVTQDGYLQTVEAGTAYEFNGNIDLYTLPEDTTVVGPKLRGASAIYAGEGSHSYSGITALSYGYISGEYHDKDGDGVYTDEEYYSDAKMEYGSKFGMAAGILVNGPETAIELDDVTVLCADTSGSNGIFAANAATVSIKNSSVITNNSQGHGLDATFGGTFYVDNCYLRTNGGASSVLSTDFGGGNFLAKNSYCESNTAGSGGIYAAGSSVFVLLDCTLQANKAEAIMCAHNNSVVVAKDCYLGGLEVYDGHQAMPSPANAVGDFTYAWNCELAATDSAIIHQQGGVTTHNIISCDASASSADNLAMVEYENGMGAGKLYINVWDTALEGDIVCAEGGTIVFNLYEGATLTGEVVKEGECEVVINVYEGGEYIGGYEANEIKESVPAPVYSDDTWGSIQWIQNESGHWKAGNSWATYQESWDTYVVPVIEAASGIVNGEVNEPSVVTASGELEVGSSDVDYFAEFIEYCRAMLIEGHENTADFSAMLDTIHEAGYDDSLMPFEMFISFGALGYDDFVAYYKENGQAPEPIAMG